VTDPAAGTAPDPEVVDLAHRMCDLAREGEAATLAAYVDAGVPVDLTDPKGDTLLMLAAYHVHPETVRALLARGASPDVANDKQQTPLVAAVFQQSSAIVTALLDAGADPAAGAPDAWATARFFDAPAMLDLLTTHRGPAEG
jgi:uncharacterized protein